MYALSSDLGYTKGPKNGALYNFATGRVIRVLDPLSGWIDELVLCGSSAEMPENVLEYLLQNNIVTRAVRSTESQTVQGEMSNDLKQIWLEITPQCNYRCIHCYAESGPERVGSLEKSRWLELIEEAGTLGFKILQFTGGDPTVHPAFMEFVRCAHQTAIPYVEVYTNAARIQAEWIPEFLRLGTRIAFSFYADNAKDYEAITQNKGSFQLASRNIKALVEAGIPVRAAVILMEENKHLLAATTQYLVDLGVDIVNIGSDAVRPTGRGNDKMCAPGMEPKLADNWAFGPPASFEAKAGKAVFKSCWNGEIVVDPMGQLFACIFARDHALGQVARQGLREVLLGQQVQQTWQLNLGSSEDCRVCEFRFACFDCRALTVALTGNTFSKPPGCRYDPHEGTVAHVAASPTNEINWWQQRLEQDSDWLMKLHIENKVLAGNDALMGCNEIAAWMLAELQTGQSVADVVENIVQEMNVPRNIVEQDICLLLQQAQESFS